MCRPSRRAYGLDCEHGEQIAVRMVALGWTGPTITRRAKIGTGLQRSVGYLAAFTARTFGQFGHMRRDVTGVNPWLDLRKNPERNVGYLRYSIV
jgi:hypothetical protein